MPQVKRLSEKKSYRPDIQGLRGVAVLMVVLFHAGLPLEGGFVGVDVFFVISGFVIAQGISRRLDEERFSVKDFYVGRIRRLLPALGVMLSIVLLLLPVLGPPIAYESTEGTAFAAATLHANHFLLHNVGYFTPSAEFNALLHTWSLSLEEQFYLLFPFVFLAFWRGGTAHSQRRRTFWGLVVVCVLSMSASLWISYQDTVGSVRGERLAFFHVGTRAWQFGIGALISLASARLKGSWLTRPWASYAGLGLIVLAGVIFDHDTVFPGVAVFVPTIGAALIVMAGIDSPNAGAVGRWLCSKPMVRMGDLSYSWYLWHWPLMVFAVAAFPNYPLLASVIAGVVSYPAAVASERFVEQPIRYRPRPQRWPAMALLAVCMLVPIGVFAFETNLRGRVLDAQGTDTLVHEVMAAKQDYKDIGCDGSHTPNDPSRHCTWGKSTDDAVYLVGDSNARQWIPALRRVAPELGKQLVATTRSTCPFVDLKMHKNGIPLDTCHNWVQDSVKELQDLGPDTVIVGSAMDYYILAPEFSLERPDGSMAHSQDEKLAAYQEGIERLVARLDAAGTQVVMVDMIPKFQHFDPKDVRWDQRYAAKRGEPMAGRCSALTLAFNGDACNLERSVETSTWPDTEPIRDMVRSVDAPNLKILPVDKELCPEGVCKALDTRKDRVLYHDYAHIAPQGAKKLIPRFKRVIAPKKG